MDGSFRFSRCFTITLGGLDLYKPSAHDLVLDAPILSGTRFKWVGENNWRMDFHCYYSSVELIKYIWIHPIDHQRPCQQRVVTPSSQFVNFINFTFLLSMWVALGKERTRDLGWSQELNFTTFHQVRTMAIQIIEVSLMMVMSFNFCVVMYLPWWWYVSLA
jgi:hypothetical protein